ncbi:YdcF family protein [Reichenbachiella ulvae]|uniref:YdcF family protein n=1 Tax=Reichenbachiella ulvae TaxID=2980104 RepID=A0ABT3CPG2_9BACT|nr:YdcF family protein [Reichenbachiella ulvae]MCV9385350.1 YdcF family protein [Reichenbachiella ulvae]
MKQNLHSYLTIVCLSLLTGCMIPQDRCKELLSDAMDEKYDVIVVPGVPYEDGDWSQIMKGRVYWSKYLYDQGVTKNIMYSGSAVYSPYYEAKIMAMYAQELGIPDSVIYTEIRAEHSTENIYYGYKKAQNLGFKKVALATDPFQASMLEDFIKEKISNEVGIIPFVIDTMTTLNTDSLQLSITDRDSLAYDQDFVSIEDRESWWKRINGTRGKNIKKNFYANGKLENEELSSY